MFSTETRQWWGLALPLRMPPSTTPTPVCPPALRKLTSCSLQLHRFYAPEASVLSLGVEGESNEPVGETVSCSLCLHLPHSGDLAPVRCCRGLTA